MDSSIIQILKDNQEYLKNSGIISDIFRDVGWLIIELLKMLAELGKTLYDYSFKIFDFTQYEVFKEYAEKITPISNIVLFISLIALSIKFMMGGDKNKKILSNFLIFAILISLNISGFAMLNDLLNRARSDIDNIQVHKISNDDIYNSINPYIIDLKKVDKVHGFTDLNLKLDKNKRERAGLSDENFGVFDPNEVLNYEDSTLSKTAQSVLAKKLTIYGMPAEADSSKMLPFTVRNVYNGFGYNSGNDNDLLNEFYYRYDISFLEIFISLLAAAMLYITMAYKNVRIGFELFISYILALFYSAEISGGERIRKILSFIRDGYILIIVNIITVKLFGILNFFINDSMDSTLVGAVIFLFLTFCLMDGATIVQRILGMDAGLGSSLGRLFAIYGASKAATKSFITSSRYMSSLFARGKDLISNADDENADDEKSKETEGGSKETEKDFDESINKNDDINGENAPLSSDNEVDAEDSAETDFNSSMGSEQDKGKEFDAEDSFNNSMKGDDEGYNDFDKNVYDEKLSDNKDSNYFRNDHKDEEGYMTDSDRFSKLQNKNSSKENKWDINNGGFDSQNPWKKGSKNFDNDESDKQ